MDGAERALLQRQGRLEQQRWMEGESGGDYCICFDGRNSSVPEWMALHIQISRGVSSKYSAVEAK